MNKTPVTNKIDNNYIKTIFEQASKEIIMPLYGKLKDSQISSKSRYDDYVTEADQKTEAFLRPKLLKLINGSNFIGEEGFYLDNNKNHDSYSEFTWVCDPIDGTFNYVNSLDKFCIMVSFCREKIPIQCWLYFPFYKIFVFSESMKSVIFLNDDNKVRVFRYKNMIKFDVLKGSVSIIEILLRDYQPKKDKYGYLLAKNLRCAGYEIVCLVCGKIDYLYHTYITPWDHSPVYILAKSSGCKVYLDPEEHDFKFDFKGRLLCVTSDLVYTKLKKEIF